MYIFVYKIHPYSITARGPGVALGKNSKKKFEEKKCWKQNFWFFFSQRHSEATHECPHKISVRLAGYTQHNHIFFI